MQDEVKVSQADERAVAEFHRQSFETLFATTDADIDAGINRAHTLLCQAFARHRHQAERDVIARMEVVAVVGNNWRLLWASGETLTAIVQRTGIKIGSPLYALPTPPAGEA